MLLTHIFCFLLLNKDLIQHRSVQYQVTAQLDYEDFEDYVQDSENNVNNNFLGESEKIGSSTVVEDNFINRVKRYEDIDAKLQILNPERIILIKDALYNYLVGHINENDLKILLSEVLKNQNDVSNSVRNKQHSKYNFFDSNVDEGLNSTWIDIDLESEESNYTGAKTIFKETKTNPELLENATSLLITNDTICRSDSVPYTTVATIHANITKHTDKNTPSPETTSCKESTNNLYVGISPLATNEHKLKCREFNDEVSNTAHPENINRTIDTSFAVSYREKPVKNAISMVYNIMEALKVVPLAQKNMTHSKLLTRSKVDPTFGEKGGRQEEKKDVIVVSKILDLISNISYANLSQNFRRATSQSSAPSCSYVFPPNYGTSPKNEYYDYDTNYTGTLVSKCYVCGLEEERIPRSTLCADAFSDDQSYTKYMYKFQKYCRYYENEKNYCVTSYDRNSVWGRWTGGCSLRMIDISDIYTQRTCRNRRKPTMGRHFASHRMAKLELVLASMKDGCITSPSASLVPLSRSVSLYARFIACVCTGDWCNVGTSHLIYCGRYTNLFTILIFLKTLN